jgi:hypothetical protein
MNKDEALDLALEALTIQSDRVTEIGKRREAITAIKQVRTAPVQEIDWKDMYEKEKRRSEMWVAKYEKDIGPLEYAAPVTTPVQEPVAWISHNAGLYHFKPDESLDPLPLYLDPPAAQPCPTCEALARTVMMDQAGTDA